MARAKLRRDKFSGSLLRRRGFCRGDLCGDDAHAFRGYESRSTRPLPHAGFVTIAALSVARSIMLAVMLGLTTIQ